MSRYKCMRDVIIEIEEEYIFSDDEIEYDMVVCDICGTKHWPAIPDIAFDDRRGKSGSKDVGGYTSIYMMVRHL